MSERNLNRRPRRIALIAVVAAFCVAVVGAGSAYAFLTGTGSGSGTAKVGQGVTFTSVGVVPTNGLLYPSTAATGNLKLRISSPVKVNLTDILPDPARSVVVVPAAPGGNGCLAASVTLGDVPTQNLTILAGIPLTVEIPTIVTLEPSAANDCQGDAFSIPVILVGQEVS